MGWFKNDPQPLPERLPESLGSKLVNAILGTTGDVARHNAAIDAAQQALKTGQQVYIADKKTNKLYCEMVSKAGGKPLPLARGHDGVTHYIDEPDPKGGTYHHTVVNGQIVATHHTG